MTASSQSVIPHVAPAPQVAPGQRWETPFAMYAVEILTVDGDLCTVSDLDTGKISTGAECETFRELWVCR
jgi:hypothetical protein